MNVKKFRGKSTAEAMKKVKQEFGGKAVILQNRKINEKRWFGLKTKTAIEVIAAMDEEQAEKKERPITQPNRKEAPVIRTDDSFLPAPITSVTTRLQEHEVDAHIIRELQQRMLPLYFAGEVKTSEGGLLQSAMSDLLVEQPFLNELNPKTKYALFVGPTGVGKTTTIAKAAALYKLKKKQRIGFITCDTYRIAAVEQLITYSKILDIPVEVAYTKEDFDAAKEKLSHLDLIFVDTAGRNYQEQETVQDLHALIDLNDPETEVILTLALTSKKSDMTVVWQQFKHLPISQLVFTKLDETKTYGAMITMMKQCSLPVLFVTNGQAVPDDMLQLDVRSFVQLFTEE